MLSKYTDTPRAGSMPQEDHDAALAFVKSIDVRRCIRSGLLRPGEGVAENRDLSDINPEVF